MKNQELNFPSIHSVVCPKCQSRDLRIRGTEGAQRKAFVNQFLFGAVGNLVANSNSKDDFSLKSIEYKCNSCKNKFAAFPVVASPEEILEHPCRITFTRLSSIYGMAVAQGVWLNGVKVASVGNGKTVTFETHVKNNTIFVTDHHGAAFASVYNFQAQGGDSIELCFKRKFK